MRSSFLPWRLGLTVRKKPAKIIPVAAIDQSPRRIWFGKSAPVMGAAVLMVIVVFTTGAAGVMFSEAGLKTQVLSDGNPAHENVTVPLKESVPYT